MSTIVTRYGKGSPLTWLEVDNNFTNLNTDKYQSGSTAIFASVTDSGLTSGRVTYAGTGGLLQDSANFVFDGSNLGLGVTPSAWTLGKAFQVNSGTLWSQANNAYVIANAYYNSGYKYLNTGYSSLYEMGSGTHVWYTAPSGTAGNAITFTQAMTITSGGQLQTTNDASIHGLTVGLGGGSVTGNTALGNDNLGSSNTADGIVAIGYQALRLNTTGANNTAIGYQALSTNTTGSSNTSLGIGALRLNTTGSYNTAVGETALRSNTTASFNTAVGYQAAYANTTGQFNTALGRVALAANTTGQQNVALGNAALYTATTASYNVAVGSGALELTTTGANNTAVGQQALNSNTTASGGTSVGYQAGYTNVSGGYNTFIGYQAGFSATSGNNTCVGVAAGYSLTSGQGNTFVGPTTSNAGYYVTTGSKNTILGGYNGNQGGLDIRTSSNYIVLSDGDGNPRGIFDNNGNFVVGSTSGNPACLLYPNGSRYTGNSAQASGWLFDTFARSGTTIGSITQSGTTGVLYNITSDQRLKENIVDAPSALAKIDSVKVRSFDFKSDGSHVEFGTIAQELYEVAPECVAQGDDGEEIEKTWGVDTSVLVPAMIKAIQELSAKVTELETKLGAK